MDDLIRRQAAIDAVLDRMNIEKYGRNAKSEEIRWTLEKLPSAQPEEASIIFGESKYGVRLWYQCSACGEPANADDNYCCNCGRKFRNG